MPGICFAAGALSAALHVSAFTVAWTHSIEKIRWEEDYRVAGRHLVLDEARIRGSGAGMEPPPDARFEHGVWHYHPPLPPLEHLRLTQSPYAAGYEICTASRCQPLTTLLPGMPAVDVVDISVCGPGPVSATRR